MTQSVAAMEVMGNNTANTSNKDRTPHNNNNNNPPSGGITTSATNDSSRRRKKRDLRPQRLLVLPFRTTKTNDTIRSTCTSATTSTTTVTTPSTVMVLDNDASSPFGEMQSQSLHGPEVEAIEKPSSSSLQVIDTMPSAESPSSSSFDDNGSVATPSMTNACNYNRHWRLGRRRPRESQSQQQQRYPAQPSSSKQQPFLRCPVWQQLISEFLPKFVLEVLGGAGAIWGFSEACGLRRPSTVWFWRPAALSVGVIFLIRFIRQLWTAISESYHGDQHEPYQQKQQQHHHQQRRSDLELGECSSPDFPTLELAPSSCSIDESALYNNQDTTATSSAGGIPPTTPSSMTRRRLMMDERPLSPTELTALTLPEDSNKSPNTTITTTTTIPLERSRSVPHQRSITQ